MAARSAIWGIAELRRPARYKNGITRRVKGEQS
jgi:hypothetical protein